jgi:hypothetical protein
MRKHVIISAIIALCAVVNVSAMGSHKNLKLKYKNGGEAREY